MGAPQYKLGYLPDRVDTRDRAFQSLLRARPMQAARRSVDWRPQIQILNQGSLGSCVVNGIFGGIRLKHMLQGIRNPKLGNRLHAYLGARSYIGTDQWDSGSQIRDGFRFLNAVGYMPEDETENGYSIRKYNEPPTPEEQRVMADQRDKGDGQVGYYRIFDTGAARREALKVAMSNEVIPVLGTTTTQAFLEYSGGILPKPSAGERDTGGHAFYLCGYDPDCAYVANSWDEDFGEQGFMRLSWEYLEWSETRDIWGIEAAPYYSHLLEVA